MTKTENWMHNSLSEIAEMCELTVEEKCLEVAQRSFKNSLAEMIAFLIDHNFEKLLWILYRIDVDEEKAKSLLGKHLPEDAPTVLADLIYQRQLKKEELKQQFENTAKLFEDDDDLRL
ncbi:MAG: hypothetical protein IPO24_18745 [Bacteroidetes bacterium]|nr:hypothetical protein [Bacteroidota bacterium]